MSHVPGPRTPKRASLFLIVLGAATMVAAPAAATGWGAKGSWEPDTTHDVVDRWMFQDPDSSRTGHKVYFNGFVGTCKWPFCTSLNPNSAQLRSDLHSEQSHNYAMLGVWKDCNGDGFIGLGDQGLWEYRAELLVGPFNTGTCPTQNVPLNAPNPNPDQVIVHNDGAWVHEFVPIQWKSWIGDFNFMNVNDNESRVWADGGVPEDDLGARGGRGGCWINPQPYGTYHNVGGLLYYADCYDGYVVTDTINMIGTDIATPEVHQRDPVSGEWMNVSSFHTGIGADHLGVGQVSFSDDPRLQWRSKSILNVKPWGEPEDASYAHAWDCTQPTQSIDVDQTVPGQAPTHVHVINVSQPGPALGTLQGASLAGTMNDTGSGFDECERNTHADGQRHWGDTLGGLPYANEAGLANTEAVPGKSSTTNMAPNEQARPGGPGSLVDKRTPPDFGVHYGSNGGFGAGTQDFWEDGVVGVGDLGLFRYTTYYAYVSPAAVTKYGLTLPNGGTTGAYGAEACGTHASGVWKGWNCDATQWYINPANGAYEPPRSGTLGKGPDGLSIDIGAKVGRPFNLRDVDCMDFATGAQRNARVADGLDGLTPQNLIDYGENTAHDTMRSTGEALAPFVQIVAPNYRPVDVVGGGNSHNC